MQFPCETLPREKEEDGAISGLRTSGVCKQNTLTHYGKIQKDIYGTFRAQHKMLRLQIFVNPLCHKLTLFTFFLVL